MKKTWCTLICLLMLITVSGCSQSSGTYAVLPMECSGNTADAQIIDRFLTDNENFSNYEEIQENQPSILSYLVDITPDALQEKCSIYRFRSDPGTSLGGVTFLIYKDEVYPIGSAFGGYGITEFAYADNTGDDILYFIYSFGSGIHRSHVGAFNFETGEITDYGGSEFEHQDIAFCLSEDGKTLGICQAQISWANNAQLEVTIEKGECIYEDILALSFE